MSQSEAVEIEPVANNQLVRIQDALQTLQSGGYSRQETESQAEDTQWQSQASRLSRALSVVAVKLEVFDALQNEPVPPETDTAPPAKTSDAALAAAIAAFQYELDSDETPRSAYADLNTLKGEIQNSLAKFVLEGTRIVIDTIHINDIRQALKLLAGTTELANPEAMLRYQRLNALMQGNTTASTALLDDLVNARKTASSNNIAKFTKELLPLRPEGAACYSPQDHDQERLLDHVEQFFPSRGESTRPAKQHCAGCVALQECLDYALDSSIRFGIWGATSERERRRIKRVKGAESKRATVEAIWKRNGIIVRYVPVGPAEPSVETDKPEDSATNESVQAAG